MLFYSSEIVFGGRAGRWWLRAPSISRGFSWGPRSNEQRSFFPPSGSRNIWRPHNKLLKSLDSLGRAHAYRPIEVGVIDCEPMRLLSQTCFFFVEVFSGGHSNDATCLWSLGFVEKKLSASLMIRKVFSSQWSMSLATGTLHRILILAFFNSCCEWRQCCYPWDLSASKWWWRSWIWLARKYRYEDAGLAQAHWHHDQYLAPTAPLCLIADGVSADGELAVFEPTLTRPHLVLQLEVWVGDVIGKLTFLELLF